MKKESPIFKGTIVLIVLGLIGLSIEFFKKRKEQSIMRHGKVCSGLVYDVYFSKRPTLPIIRYYYIVNNKKYFYECNVDDGTSISVLEGLENKYLNLVYDSTDFKKSKLLVFESDYKRFDVPYPDSMLWLKRLLGK